MFSIRVDNPQSTERVMRPACRHAGHAVMRFLFFVLLPFACILLSWLLVPISFEKA